MQQAEVNVKTVELEERMRYLLWCERIVTLGLEECTIKLRPGGVTPMIPHFILTLGRSGSNTLTDLLNQNPAFFNYGEVMGPWTYMRKLQRLVPLLPKQNDAYLDFLLQDSAFLRNLLRYRNTVKHLKRQKADIKSLEKIRTVGVKDFSLHLQRAGIPNYLVDRERIKVIGLVRLNLLDRMVSNALLQETGVVANRTGKQSERGKLTLDPCQIIPQLEVIEEENRKLTDCLRAIPEQRCMTVTYEDFFRDDATRTRLLTDIMEFLEIPVIRPEVRMQKIASAGALGTIENADAVREVIIGTRFEQFLSHS